MLNIESGNRKVKAVAATAATAFSALALTGCGIIGKSNESASAIPNCPSGYEGSTTVADQDTVISAYETAGQILASDYKTQPTGTRKRRLGIAFSQLFEAGSSGGLFNAGVTTTSERLTPDAYLADDPGELMCEAENDAGQEITVLSPNAIEAKAILKSVGIEVKLRGSVK